MPKMICCFEKCKRKISLVQQTTNKCKCDLLFCKKHKAPEKHKCCLLIKKDKFDLNKKDNIDTINNMKCISNKLEKI